MVQTMRSSLGKMKRSKSFNPTLISRSSQTLTRHRSFILDEKDIKNRHGDQGDVKLEKMYMEAEESFEQGEYENALIKFGNGVKADPKNNSFVLGVKKSKDAIMNDLISSSDILKQLQEEIDKYPKAITAKEKVSVQAINKSVPFINEAKKSPDLDEVKSQTIKASSIKVKEKKLEPTYELTIHNGTAYQTITATAQEVKQYLKDKNYFQPKDQIMKDWKKLRYEFNKKLAEKEAVQRIAREARKLEERNNIRHHCEEQISLIGRHYQNGKMTDVIRFSENFIKYLNKKPDKTLPRKWIYLATVFNYLARANAEQGDFEKAKKFGEKLYRIAITSSNAELLAQSYILSGKIYVRFERYKEAAFVWEKLIPLIQDNEKKAWLFHEIGRCYFETGKYDQCLRHGRESAHWAGKCGSSIWTCSANVLLGQAEMKRSRFEQASKNFEEARKHAELGEDEQTLNYINSMQEIIRIVLDRNRVRSVDENSTELNKSNNE